MKKVINIYKFIIFTLVILLAETISAQTFPKRTQVTLNGDMTVIGNNILSRPAGRRGSGGAEFNRDGNNDSRQEYINIDSDGDKNFSSSSAELIAENFGGTKSDCSKVKQAFLYWAGLTDRRAPHYSDFNKVRLKLPEATDYVDVEAKEVIKSPSNKSYNDTYVCYADVTDLIKGNGTVLGNYTVANVVAKEYNPYAAGWSLVIIYENAGMTVKNISLFDGFSGITPSSPSTILIDGFQTPNTNFTTKIAVSTLEGERNLSGDRFRIKAGGVRDWTLLGNSRFPNKIDNFFDSTITIDDKIYPNRNPASTNTLGYDLDYFTLNNSNFEIMPKGETSAALRATSTGDWYYIFFVAFNVETIAPKINLVKSIKDKATGADLLEKAVSFSQSLVYELEFQNVGNDDAVDVVLTDKVPENVNFRNNIDLPSGVIFRNYDEASRTVKYDIDPSLVTKKNPQKYTIKIEVQLVGDCSKLRNVCSNKIENLAYIEYKGKLNQGKDIQYSYNSMGRCGLVGDPSSTTFLIVDGSCNNYINKVSLCGKSVDLVAGSGFSSYRWVKKGSTDVLSTTQTLRVTESMGVGKYIVTKGSTPEALSCKNALKEIFEVAFPDDTDFSNPLRKYATHIERCPNDNKEFIQFFLCGTNDTKRLSISESGKTITWHKMTAKPAGVTRSNCPFFLDEGTWVQMQQDTDSSVYELRATDVSEAGTYYAVTIWDNIANCGQSYYFQVFKSDFTYEVEKRNRMCDTSGKITVKGLSGYEYRFQKEGITSTTTPTWQSSPTFTVPKGDEGSWNIYVRQVLSDTTLQDNVCEYKKNVFIENIKVADQIFLTPTPVKCKDGKGALNVVVSDKIYAPVKVTVTPQGGTSPVSEYTITTATGGNRTKEITGLNNTTYDVRITTDDNCDVTKTVTVDKIPDLTITSIAGEPACGVDIKVNVQVNGGELFPSQTYGYKIETIDTDYRYYPNTAHNVSFDFSDLTFTSGVKTYTLNVIDKNNCQTSFTFEVERKVFPTFTLDPINDYCDNLNASGKIRFTVTNPSNLTGIKYYIRKQLADGTYTDTNWQVQPAGVGVANNIFYNLGIGKYEAKLEYRIGSSVCETATQATQITEEGRPIIAAAGVSQIACDASGDGTVRITNVQGGSPQGTPPQYYYKFDEGGTWTTTSTSKLPPGGPYTIYVSDTPDGLGCTYSMEVTVPPAPINPTFTISTITYDCEGKGTVTITDDQNTYDYKYEYPTGTFTTSNVISGLATGTQTITVYYNSTDVPTPSILLEQDFGIGKEGQCITDIDSEASLASTYACVRTITTQNQYTITDGSGLKTSTWGSNIPTDPTTPGGRYLAIDILTGGGNSIFEKKIYDVIPNRPLKIEFKTYNLYGAGKGYTLPEIQVRIETTRGAFIAESNRISVQEDGTWHLRELELNPGNNSSLIFKITSFNDATAGNDLAIDDIKVYQVPEICPQYKTVTVTVEAGKAFAISSGTGAEQIIHQQCYRVSDGQYSLSLDNVGGGYEYRYRLSRGSWSGSATSTANPLVLSNLAAGNYELELTKDGKPNCQLTKTFTINPAQPLSLSLDNNNKDLIIACDQTSVQITASATGGTGGGYKYILTQPNGTVTTQTTKLFTNLTQTGTYTMTVRDANGCGSNVEKTFQVAQAQAPVLSIDESSTNYCLGQGSNVTIVVGATGGDATSYDFSIEPVVPKTGNRFEISNAGTYTIKVSDKYHCSDTQTVTIAEPLQVSAAITKEITCGTNTNAKIEVTASNGYPPYTYQVRTGTGAFQDITGAVITATTEIIYETGTVGTYEFQVLDSKGCNVATTNSIEIVEPQNPEVTLSATDVKCNGGLTELDVNIQKGVPNYIVQVLGVTYSQTQTTTTTGTTTFYSVPAGNYTVTVVDDYHCESEVKTITITEPERLSGYAGVTRLVSCGNGQDAEVRVSNVQGGTPPYQYSFDHSPFSNVKTGTMSVGKHNVIIKDANDCELPIEVEVLPKPLPPTAPSITDADIKYNCNGTAYFTITPTRTASYTYTFALDGTENTPPTSTLFEDVSTGTHTITLTYKQKEVVPNIFFKEDFGAGTDNVTSPFMSSAYRYESQAGGDQINDGEYCVTSKIDPIYGTWRNPNDASGKPNGRFLAINVGAAAFASTVPVKDRGIVYQRPLKDVDPTRPIIFSLKAFNLLKSTSPGKNPNLEIILMDASGTNIITTKATGFIPKNTGANDWKEFKTQFEPNGQTEFIVKIKTESRETSGNDVAIDDISVYQIPEDCGYELKVPVTIPQGKEFKSTDLVEISPITCNGASDGKAKITIDNFLPTEGYKYSVDGGTPTTTTTATLEISNLNAGTHTLVLTYIDKDGVDGCQLTRTVTLEEPSVVSATATITTVAKCSNNNRATIKVSAKGGAHNYQYIIDGGTSQSSAIFNGVPTGTHTITVIDSNNCQTKTPIVIDVPEPKVVQFTATPISCFDGSNGDIVVTVTDGNGNYKVSLGSNAPITIPTGGTYTFTGRRAGTYTITVTDGYSCKSSTTVMINEKLGVKIRDFKHISSCKPSTFTLEGVGGAGNYVYAVVPQSTTVTDTDFTASLTRTITTAGTYDIYVRDNDGNSPYCQAEIEKVIKTAETLSYTLTATDPVCYTDNHNGGSISIKIDKGEGAYGYNILTLSGTSVASANNLADKKVSRYGLAAGTYSVVVSDKYGCTLTKTIVINRAEDLVAARVVPRIPSTCSNVTDYSQFGFAFETATQTTSATLQYNFYLNGTLNRTWTTTNIFLGIEPGTQVRPVIRTINAAGDVLCSRELPVYTTTGVLGPGAISLSTNTSTICTSGLSVTVRANQGLPPYNFRVDKGLMKGTWQSGTTTTTTASGTTETRHIKEFTGLTPGRSYKFFVKDKNGCVSEGKSLEDVYTPTTEITVGTVTPVCSSGGANGAATIMVNDKTGSYISYNWELYSSATGSLVAGKTGNGTFASGKATISLTGLEEGTYFLKLEEFDLGGATCTYASEDFVIRKLEELKIGSVTVVQEIGCEVPGVIELSAVTGGNGSGYKFTVESVSSGLLQTITTTNQHIEIDRGKITQNPITTDNFEVQITVEDIYGCSTTTRTTVSISKKFDFDYTTENCGDNFGITVHPYKFTSNNGTATNTVFATEYAYSIGNGFEDNGGIFTDLRAGTYTLTVKEKSTGCTVEKGPVTIYPKLKVDEPEILKKLDCTGSPDATIKVTIPSGSEDYKVMVNGAIDLGFNLGDTTKTFTVSAAGTYTVTVKDKITGCTDTVTLELADKITPEFTVTATSITCYEGTTSIIIDEVDKGTGPYSYTLLDGASNPVSGVTFNTSTLTFDNVPGIVGGAVYKITSESLTNSCTTSQAITIIQPAEIIIPNSAVTVTEFACSSANVMNEAIVTVSPTQITGGTNSFTHFDFVYTANDGNVETRNRVTDPVFRTTNISGGTVSITAYDTNGCSNSTVYEAEIKPFNELISASVSVTKSITCVNDEEVNINVVTTTATTHLEYRLGSSGTPQSSSTFTGLGIGNYTFYVTNTDTGCEISVNHTVTDPNRFRLKTPKVTNPVCKGGDGSVDLEIEPNGYTGGFTWEVISGTATITGNETNSIGIPLKAGNYTATIVLTSSPECTQETTFRIIEPAQSLTSTIKVTSQTCALDDGVIQFVNTQGGWGEYEYYVGVATPTSTNYVRGKQRWDHLSTGTYQVWVKDKAGCEVQLSDVGIVTPTQILATLTITTQNCNGSSGEIRVNNTTGGAGSGYKYQLIKDGNPIGTPMLNKTSFKGLSEGEYTVRITDGWTCSATLTAPVTLYAPIPLRVDKEVVKEITCADPKGATVKVLHSGGSNNIEYRIYSDADSGMTYSVTTNTATFTGLVSPTSYKIEVRDLDTNCGVSMGSFSLVGAETVSYTYVTTSPTCFGASDGTIVVNLATTSQPPYEYKLEKSGMIPIIQMNNGMFTGLPKGVYTLTVTSSRSCTQVEVIELKEPNELVATETIIPFACSTTNLPQQAEIVVTPQGGTPPYYYSLDGIGYVIGTASHTFYINDTGADQNITYYVRDSYGGCGFDKTVRVNTLPKITNVTATQIIAATCSNAEYILITITGGGSNGFEVTEITTGVTKTIPAGANQTTFSIQEPGSYTFKATSLQTVCSLNSEPYRIDNYRTINVTAQATSTVSCKGASDGKIEIDVQGYRGRYNYEVLDGVGNLLPSLGGSSNTSAGKHLITGLPAGRYKVRVEAIDTPYCSATSTLVNIGDPLVALTVSITQTSDLTCNGGDATIRAEADGGWGQYQYRLYQNGVLLAPYDTYTTTTVFTNLPGGDYVVEVKDRKGCEVRSDATAPKLIINTPNPITADIRAIPSLLSCSDSADGTIEVRNVRGGSMQYRYILINNDTNVTITTITGTVSAGIGNAIFEGLSEGNYRVEITDGWDCGTSLTGNVVSISVPVEVTAMATISRMPTCSTDGEITVRGSGGSGIYTYDVSPTGAFTNTTGRFTVSKDVTATYKYYVKDTNGCSAESNEVQMDKVEVITTSLDVSASNIDISCNGDNTGKLVILASGGVGGYEYELTGTVVSVTNPDNPTFPMVNNTGVFDGLTAGDYTVTIKGTGDCDVAPYVATFTQPITESPALVVQTATHTNVSCTDKSDGKIEVEVTGGTGIVQYAISPLLSKFSTQRIFEDLPEGNYTVIAQDEKGCSKKFEFKVTKPAPIKATILGTTDELCAGANDGTVSFTITGGTPPYRVVIDAGSEISLTPTTATYTTMMLSNVAPSGTRKLLTVKDANNCEGFTLFTINPGVDLQATVTVSYTCVNNDIGQIIKAEAVSSEVTSIDKYVLDEGTASEVTQTTPTFIGKYPVGTHTMTYYHTGGCIKDVPFDIKDVSSIQITSIDVTDLKCAGNPTGKIEVNVSSATDERGNLRTFRYSISPNPNNVPVGDTQDFFNDLPGGVYTITIEDPIYGCMTQTSVKVIEPAPLVVSITQHIDESCYGDNDGALSFFVTGGRPDYRITVKYMERDGTLFEAYNNTISEGETVSMAAMKPGEYYLSVADAGYRGDACELTLQKPIVIKRAPNLLTADKQVDYICPTGTSTTITNEVIVEFPKEEFKDWSIRSLTYSLNSASVSDAQSFDEFIYTSDKVTAVIKDVPPGDDQFMEIFFRGCHITIRDIDVKSYSVLRLEDISKANEPNLVRVKAEGGRAPYTYSFNDRNTGGKSTYYLQRLDETVPLANGRIMKKVKATVIDDLGCEQEIEVLKEFIELEIPEYFTPNGDGENDTWAPKYVDNYPNIETQIYDRSGRLITVLKQSEVWDGTYRGKELPTGDYWYIIYLNEDADDSREFVGHMNLYR